jgi:hypothetical protein
MTKNKRTTLALSVLTLVSLGTLTACGQGTDAAAPSSTSVSPPVPAGAMLHRVDAPLDEITKRAEHCFASVADAMLARQRTKDFIADRNATVDAKRAAHEANPDNELPYMWEVKLRVDESTPYCYKVTLLNPPPPGTTVPA